MVKITKELGVGKDGYQTGGVEYKEEVGKVVPAVGPRWGPVLLAFRRASIGLLPL